MSKENKKQKTMLVIGYLMVALALVLAACGAPTPEATPEPAPVEPAVDVPEISQPIARWNSVSEAGTWVLMGYGDALNPTVVEPGTYVTINFSTADNAVNGAGGCNNYNTTYTADDYGILKINGPIISTTAACETGMDQEGLFLGALETVSAYNLTDDGRLLLDYNSGAVYDEKLEFVRGTPLVGTQWILTAYGDPNFLTASQTGVMTNAIFTSDGIMSGLAVCNQYSAGYNLQGNQIAITSPTSTLMACETGADQEQAFLAGLEKAASYRLSFGALDIITVDGTMLRFSAQHLPLENVRWELASIDGQPLPDGVIANALFTPAGSTAAQGQENTVNGGAGCNTFFGSYNIDGDTFKAGPFGVTKMMCDEAVMQVEQAFLAGLESAQNYQIALNQMLIKTENGSLLLYANRMPLEGPLWTLTGMGPVENPQPPTPDTAFTANFVRQFGMPSGVKSGGTGCRNYNAAYYAGLDDIKLNLPQADQVTCSDAQTEAEQKYFLSLNAAREYRILGNQLYVYFDKSVLVYEGSYPEIAGGPLTSLNGTQWWFVSLDTFLAIPGTEVTILFDINPDGRTGTISGSGGCNMYNAGITDVFTLTPINATASLCDTPAGVSEQEAAFFNALGTANGISVDGDTLRITTALETIVFTNVGPAAVQPLPPQETPEASLPLPITALINAPTEGLANQPVIFDGSLSSSNVEITSYSWSFGDDVVAEGSVIEHLYVAAGVYDVILTITDANGESVDASIVITIN